MIYYGSQGTYQLATDAMASGGEGAIFEINNHPDLVAKLYNQDKLTKTLELEKKIIYMVNNPPSSSEVLAQIAWPIDVLRDGAKQFVGFVMPKLKTNKNLEKLYSYDPDKSQGVTYEHRVIIAHNICVVIYELHKAGYVFGDFNPRNIGVNTDTGIVGFYDTDSYHVTDFQSGHTYRCAVCTNGYTAPEVIKILLNKQSLETYPLPTFTKETDYFALAIHIFKLLMNGYTPFNGIKENETVSQASPPIGNDAIIRNNYCFKPGNKPQSAAIPELSSLSPQLQLLFKKTFIGGATNPEDRATAEEWEQALTEYMQNLKHCDNNPDHYYYAQNNACPYCEADKRYRARMSQATQTHTTGQTGHAQVTFTNPVTVPLTQRQVNQSPTQQYQPYQPYQSQANNYPRTKTKKNYMGQTIGRILLWIFFFPIMLVITIFKSRIPMLGKLLLACMSISLCGSLMVSLAGGLSRTGGYSGMGKKDIRINVDISSLMQESIVGYNGFGYFNTDPSPSGIYEITGEDDEASAQVYSYTLRYTGRSEDEQYAQFNLSIDQGATPIGDITIRTECNKLLSNGEMLTFEILQQSAEGYRVVLENNTMRVNGLTEGDYVRDDPRDQFVLTTTRTTSDGWYTHDWVKFEFLETEYTVGDKTIRLTLVEDKRPGAEAVHPGFSFDVYDSDGTLLFAGSYLFVEMKYDANYDDYGNTDEYWFHLVPQFDQAVMLDKTGILFNNTEKEFKLYN